MGPYYLTAIVALLGPIVRVAGLSTTFVAERTIEIGPRRGERFAAETPTHTTAALELVCGATATLLATFEAPSHYSSTFLVLGSEGTLLLPDPNMSVQLSASRASSSATRGSSSPIRFSTRSSSVGLRGAALGFGLRADFAFGSSAEARAGAASRTRTRSAQPPS